MNELVYLKNTEFSETPHWCIFNVTNKQINKIKNTKKTN